jgi:hypothetical protein
LLCGEVAFYEDLESVADGLRILITKRADALLQLGEGMKVIVQTAPYQRSCVGVL